MMHFPNPPMSGWRNVMQDDQAFYERRLREELARSFNEQDPYLRQLHRRWAALYKSRLLELSSGLPAAT